MSKSESPLKKTMWYSFLDLICCSLGAAFLLLLISVVAQDKNSAHNNNLLIIRAVYIEGFKAEIGIEYKAPSAVSWQRQSMDKIFVFSALSKPSSGAEAFLLINNPDVGKWSFRPFLVNYPHQKDDLYNHISVKLEITGKFKPDESIDQIHKMKAPGEEGDVVTIHYNGRSN